MAPRYLYLLTASILLLPIMLLSVVLWKNPCQQPQWWLERIVRMVAENTDTIDDRLATPNFCASAPRMTMETGEEDPWFLNSAATSETGNYDDFWDALECQDHFYPTQNNSFSNSELVIHNQSTWIFLRGIYLGIVGPRYSTIDPNRLLENGFQVPVRVQQIPGKGRGVVALEDIPSGTFVWDVTQTARFPSALHFRRFLASLLPRRLACDVLIWAYVEDYSYVGGDDDDDDTDEKDNETNYPVVSSPPFHGARPLISVDLDEASFINTFMDDSPSSSSLTAAAASIATKKNIDNASYRTTRRIRAGEELIVDYSDFERLGSWKAAGFGSERFVIEHGHPAPDASPTSC